MSAEKVPPSSGDDFSALAATERLTQLIYRASHSGRRLRRWLAEHVAHWKLGDNEFLVLWLCDAQRNSGLGQGELAAATGVSPAQMSSLVEGMRQRELIAVQRLAGDRRRQVWQITGTGQTLLGEVRTSLADLAARLEQQITSDEQAAAADIFQRLTQLATAESTIRLYDPGATEQAAPEASPAGGAAHA